MKVRTESNRCSGTLSIKVCFEEPRRNRLFCINGNIVVASVRFTINLNQCQTQWQVLWNIEADLEIVKCPRLVFDVNASKCEIKTKASLSPLTKLWNWKLEMASSILLALTLGWLSQAYRAMVVGQGLGNKIILGWMIALDQTIIFGQ